MSTIKIKADTGACQGHARCHALVPDLFELNDEGYIGFGERIIASSRQQDAQRAARACPEQALRVMED